MKISLVKISLLLSALSLPAPAFAIAPPSVVCGTNIVHVENNTQLIIESSSVQTSTINVSVPGINPKIWDIDLKTFIRHTAAGDLEFTLQSPAGTIVTISTNNGGLTTDVFNGTTWDDQANPGGTVPYEIGPGQQPTNNGLVTDTFFQDGVLQTSLVPEEPLGAFNGENPNGNWLLTINDAFQADEGFLDKWSLDISVEPTLPFSSVEEYQSSAPPLVFGEGAPATIQSPISVQPAPGINGRICGLEVNTPLNHPSSISVQAALTSPSGTVVTLTSNIGSGQPGQSDPFHFATFTNTANPHSQVPYGDVSPDGLITDMFSFPDGAVPLNLTPVESLAAFHGELATGEWTLTASDTDGFTTGILNGWQMSITYCKPVLDADSDLTGDECDGCAQDPLKIAPGVCGCGVPDDSNGDGQVDGADVCDFCPNDPNKEVAGLCGCGVVDTDSDGDTVLDCFDTCQTDPAKVSPGLCGCGVADLDFNKNGIPECKAADEAKARIATLASVISEFGSKINGKPPSAKILLQQKRKLKIALSGAILFSKLNAAQLSVSSGVTLSSSLNSITKTVGALLRSTTKQFENSKVVATQEVQFLASSFS